MPHVKANGIRIEYEEFGQQDSTPVLLIMGLGAQMVIWDERFCKLLAGKGFRVIRYDNRDVGLSTKFDKQCPDPGPLFIDVLQGKNIVPPYTLEDMADDAAGLLQELGIPAAHVIGASMGGMIAQSLAIRHPDCVLTLTSIMSTTGNPDLPQADPEVLAILAQPIPTEREAAIEHAVVLSRVIGSPGFKFDEERTRMLAELCYERDSDPVGPVRQMLAIMTAASRKDALRSVAVPTLVIHGAADPLVPIAGGFDTAEAIPGAKMLVIEGMGHDMPEDAWPRLTDAFLELTRQIE
jgi:pimeloyl-ACP methyl ester carboxylesterase